MASDAESGGIETQDVGLYILSDPVDAAVDIVFVHGIQGHPQRTWTYASDSSRSPSPSSKLDGSNGRTFKVRQFFKINDNKASGGVHGGKAVFWPRDLLAKDFPKARIMTFGYDSIVTKGLSPVNQGNIFTHAEDLLHALEEKRRQQSTRDLIFIAHSLGGILVKEALRRSETDVDEAVQSVYAATTAIFFFGTPHRGSKDWADFGRQLASVASRLLNVDTNDRNIRSLLPSSHELSVCHMSLMQQIEKRGISMTIRTFQEQKAMSGIRLGVANELIVPSDSSRLDIPRERPRTVNADHMQMVRFRSSSDQTYQTVKADINEILQRRAKHWKAVEVTRGDTEHKSEDNLNMNYECFAKCAQDKFETKDVKRPVQRRFVKIPCPMHKCDQERPCDWLCANCAAPLEYGFTDDYIYCGCGRSLYMHWAFKCDKRTHGVDFCEHESSTLLAMLRSLKPFSWLNILILGETGVGKSTFINALVNYLEFEKFDDALDSGDLISLVPSSFSIQNMHDKDPDKEIEETIIQTGSRPDEDNRSTGQSATQQTNVYPVTFSSGPKIYGVRLIDTPGIGDTRGIQYDKKNMADILSTMNTYDELHGILILSKPNSSRLTSTFEYCMKELLTYLHQSAAANIVFGFTNSRASLYTPGDTFNTLKTMISKSDGMGLKLTQRVIYCFDSESFRYLAAYKQDVKLNDKKEFENSWDQSRQETQRMLDHFRTIQPHKTQSTMSLNGAREIIMALTKPMAEISRLITTNIAVCEEQRKAMKTKHFTGEELKKRLHVQIIEMRSEPLPHPRTVCTNVRCKKIQDDGTNRTEKYTIYKTHCHPVCSLANVPIDVLAPESLRGCTAFDLGRRDTCLECGHHWQEHMHVTYELKQYNKMVVDEKIQMKLDANTNDVILRETAIAGYDQRIKEYKEERAIIRHATAAFGVFLKKYAITPYNDAAASYTEFMIQAEKDKIQVGGSRKNLLILEQNLRMHKEEVASIEASMCLDPTSVDISEGAVDRTVKSLFALKHFGRNLKKLQKDTSFAHKSTYREIPYQVRRKTVDSKRGNKGKDKFSVPLQDAPRRGSTWWFNS